MQYLEKIAEFLEQRQKAFHKREEKPGSDTETIVSRTGSTKSLQLSDSVGGSDEFQGKSIGSAMKSQLADEGIIGTLLPLNCGHNGVLRYAELNLYEKHLVTAGILAR